MRITLRKFSSILLSALLTAVAFFTGSSAASAQDQTRSFRMGVWTDPTHADSDIAIFGPGVAQPRTGLGIAVGIHYDEPLTDWGYDWSRVVAVEIDEPYRSLNGGLGPCEDQGALDAANAIDADLQLRANELKALNPKARFWVNFTPNQIAWIMDSNCLIVGVTPLNKPYIDVISIDDYSTPFAPAVAPNAEYYYVWLAANPAKPDQQLALVPGVFSSPQNQGHYLQGYFDYANYMNQSCTLPLGSQGVTGISDRCPVWFVLGWIAETTTSTDGKTTYVGMLDPASASIKQEWENELGLPLAPSLANQLSPAQILTPIYQLLLK